MLIIDVSEGMFVKLLTRTNDNSFCFTRLQHMN